MVLFSSSSVGTVYAAAMRQACGQARLWIGATSPNPPVGAVALDAGGNIIAAAAHRRAGAAHAETLLLEECRNRGLLPNVETICVTLEPCNHYGRTPPCTDAIIAAGIRRIVIGAEDPNPAVKGGGAGKLRQAGLEVLTGVCEEECRRLIHAFAYSCRAGEPWITVKRAFDGKGSMEPPQGRKTFTSPESLRLAHRLRKKSDAIITGSGTVLADSPLFTVRYVDDYPGKRRRLAILDRRRRVPQAYLDEARERGLDAEVYGDIREAVTALKAAGAQDILVEAGPTLSSSMLRDGLWTMAVTITRGDTDRIAVEFNADKTIPFATDAFDLEGILPA